MPKRKNIGFVLPISILSLFAVFLSASFLFLANFDYANAQSLDFSISTQGSKTVVQGSGVTNLITLTRISGTTTSVFISVSGVPVGVTAALEKTSCLPTCTSILTLSPLPSAAPGNYVITVKGSYYTIEKTTSFTLTVNPSPVNGVCGTNANTETTAYESTVTSYSGTFCSVGTADPSSPAFPSPSSFLSTWHCLGSNGGTDAYCKAYKKNPTPVLSVTPSIVNPGGNVTFSWNWDQYAMSYLIYYYKNGVWDSTGTWVSGTSVTVSTAGLISLGAKVYSHGIYISSNPSNEVFVTIQAFNFSLSNEGNKSVTKVSGSVTVNNTITVTKSAGTAASVALTASGMPAGVTASFSPTSCTPNTTCSSILTLSVASSASAGNYTITISGSPSGGTTSFILTVNVPSPVNGSCGTNANTQTTAYESYVTSYSGTFCSVGTADPSSPIFPSPNLFLTTWNCFGSNGGTNAYCTAYRKPTTPVLSVSPLTPVVIGSGSNVTFSWTYDQYAMSYLIYYYKNGVWDSIGTWVSGTSATVSTAGLTSLGAKVYSYDVYIPSNSSNQVFVTFSQPFDFSLSNAGARSIVAGGSFVTNTITVTKISGTAANVTFSASGLPTGVTASFSPTSCTPNDSCTSTITLNALSSTSGGNYTITVSGSNGTTTRYTYFTLSVSVPFNYSLANGGFKAVQQGSSVTNTITVTKISGTASAVALYASGGPPSGLTMSFSPASCTPNNSCSSNITLLASSSAAAGNYTITVSGSPSGGTTSFTLNIYVPAGPVINGSCGTNTNTAATAYEATKASYSGTFCSSGAVNPSSPAPAFPLPGGSVAWNCVGSGGGSTASCAAYKKTETPTVAFSPATVVAGENVTFYWTAIPYATSYVIDYYKNGVWERYTTTLAYSVVSTIGLTSLSAIVYSCGVSTCSNQSYQSSVPIQQFDFSLSNAGARSVVKGNSVLNTITVSRTLGSISKTVSLSAGGVPSGVTATLSPTSCIPNGSCTSTITLSASASAVAGNYTITVNGSDGTNTRNTSFTLSVVDPFNYSLTNEGSKTVNRGSSTSNTVTVTKTAGIAAAVSLTYGVLPSGVTASFSQTSCVPGNTCTSTMFLNAGSNATLGTYTIVVTGTSGSISKTTSFSLVVASVSAPVPFDYSIFNVGDKSVIKGNQTTNTITVTKTSGTAASVGFLVSGLPTGVIAGFSPTSCIPDLTCSSTLTLTSSVSSPAGTYSITVTGTSGSVSRTTSFTLTLIEPDVFDYSLSNGGGKIIYLGSYATNSIYVTKIYGTPAPVAFTAIITPSGSGLSTSFSPTSCTPDASCSSSFILTSSAFTVPGNYTVTVTGTSGSVSRTTSFSLTVWTTPAPSCPFTDEDGSVFAITTDTRLVDRHNFTPKPQETASYIDAQLNILPGLYTIKTYSWDNYDGRIDQPNETWNLEVYNGDNLLGKVGPMDEIVGGGLAQSITTFFEGLNISQNATKMRAIHKCYEDGSCNTTSPSSVVPVCAAFKKSDALLLTVDQVTTNPVSPILKNTDVDVSAYISTNIEDQTSNFTYYCDSINNDAVLIDPPEPSPYKIKGKHDGVSANKFEDTFADLCNYSSTGQYWPKVVVERGGKIAAGRTLVEVISEIPEDENWPPSATNLMAVSPSDYCVSPFSWTLRWAFSDPYGESQSAYQIIIRDVSSGSLIKDTGKINSSSNSYAIPSGTLSFNKTYSWSVTVWDSNQNSLSSNSNGPNFTTMKHTPPSLSADINPNKISLNEIITITDTTTVYGGSTKSAWNWNFSNVTGYTLITEPPLLDEIQVKFTTPGSKNIILKVTDSDGYWCERGFNYSSTDALPDINFGRSPSNFREVVP
jgi:VCBS repeat-containing protein